jgi:hypothetical protein
MGNNMKVIKKYTAMMLTQDTKNREVSVQLGLGYISGPHYDENHPKIEHDTEDDAISYAYETDRHATWAIIPIINFESENTKQWKV